MIYRLSAPFWLSLSFIGFYGAYGVFLPFIPVWMKAYAYSAETISFVLAISFLFRFLGSMVLSNAVKHPGMLLFILRIIGVISIVLTALLALTPDMRWLTIPLIWLYTMVNGAGMPLGDALAGTWLKQQVKFDYGRVRLMGSISFVIANLLTGYIASHLGDKVVMWVLVAYLALYIVVQIPTPTPLPKNETHGSQTDSKQISYKELFKDSKIFWVIMILSGIQGSHAAYYTYSILFWIKEGISVETTGVLWGLSVAGEVLMFFVASKLFKHRSFYQLLWLSSFVCLVRWTLFGLTSNMALLIIIQLMHAVTFAVCHFATIRYFANQPSHHIPKLQALYAGVSNCLAVALLIIVAGWIYKIDPAWAFMLWL